MKDLIEIVKHLFSKIFESAEEKEVRLKKERIEKERIEKEQAEKQKKERELAAKAQAEKEQDEKEWIEKQYANQSSLLFFSSSLVSENSPLFLIREDYNDSEIIQSSKTNLKTLYSQGWKLSDIDKTGKSAQLDSINCVIRVSK